MIYLLLSILSATAIMVVFKLFDQFKVNTLPAIVVNYWFAALLSFVLNDNPVGLTDFSDTTWFFYSILLGLLFVGLFYLFGLSTRIAGASVTTVSAKMSLVVPVCFALFFYNDSFDFLKLAGIVLALLSVYLIAKSSDPEPKSGGLPLLPVLVFASTGFADTFINYIQRYKLESAAMESFTGWVFITSAIAGTLLLAGLFFKTGKGVNLRSLLGGIALAVPNYFSLFFLLKALQVKGFESSVVIPVNNMSIVALTALAGIFVFKEQLSRVNLLGLCCCFGACMMILFSGG